MNKFNKGKTLGIVAASLASVALVGVGFSTWIIQSKEGTTSGGINVTVAETKDLSVKISNAQVDSKEKVNFDADHNQWVKDKSIFSCGESDTQDLSFTITYDVTMGADVQSWTIMAAIVDTTDGDFNTAVNTKKYITLPDTLGLGSTATTTACASGNATKKGQSTTFTFVWGKAFAGKNPVAVTTDDHIYTGKEGATDGMEIATAENLKANTTGLKGLNLSSFTVKLSVGNVSMKTSVAA